MQKRRLHSVQALRAIAAILVALHHSQRQVAIHGGQFGPGPALCNGTPSMVMFGAYGVDIFFILSGFIMAYVTRNHRGDYSYASVFLKKRIIRVVPVYWFWTFVMIMLLIGTPQLVPNSSFEVRGTLLSFLLLPYTPEAKAYSPVLPVGWTLSFEMYFYVLVACGLALRQHLFLLFVGGYFAACLLIGPYIPFWGKFIQLATSPLLFEFFAGFALCLLFTSTVRLPLWLPAVLFVAALGGYALWLLQDATLPIAVPAFLLVASLILWEKNGHARFPRGLVAVGDSSYSLYLTNFFVTAAMTRIVILLGLGPSLPPDVYIAGTTFVCILVGHAAYRLVEIPLTNFATRIAGLQRLPAH